MDTASEFLTMAATLVYIKSRSLLPRPPKEEEEGEDPAETLIRQLREYKAIKLAGQRLQELEQAARGMYTKLPEEFLLPPQEVVWEGGTREGLFETFLELLHKRELAQENAIQDQEVRADTFTVRTAGQAAQPVAGEIPSGVLAAISAKHLQAGNDRNLYGPAGYVDPGRGAYSAEPALCPHPHIARQPIGRGRPGRDLYG